MKHQTTTLLILGLPLLLVLLVSVFSTFEKTKWPSDGWIKYRTANSEGPRRQLRIFYHNASAWSRNNPHDHGEWGIRLDDQALIPAELYDEDEDRYQQWFINRYPEMHQVVLHKQHIRPSWLGSLQVEVPWDHQFHLAHCVMTLRRYWKARESGTHVCPRDIDYWHIKHCLDWFDAYAFPLGPKGGKSGEYDLADQSVFLVFIKLLALN